jgi:hypothetical protein
MYYQLLQILPKASLLMKDEINPQVAILIFGSSKLNNKE